MNIYETIYQNNIAHPQKRAMSITMNNGDKRIYTYGDTFEKVEAYSRILEEAGLQPGDRIAFVAESSPEWTVAFLASCKLCCTAALIDASMTAEELNDFIVRSDVRAAFFSPATAEKCKDILPTYAFPVFNVLDCSTFDGCKSVLPPDFPATPDPDPTLACIIFSSGTTRVAAGIMHTHDNLINTTQMTLGVQNLQAKDRYLAVLPNSHIYGVICQILGPLLPGADVHYIESLTADAVLGAFAEYHPTVLPAVPKMYELFMMQIMRKINSNPVTKTMYKVFFPICLRLRRKNGSLLGKKIFKSIHDGFGGCLEFLSCAGAPLSPAVAEFYYGTGFNILITYGSSETNIPTIGNVAGTIQTDSCGKPYPDIQLKFSESGEILLKSPYMMRGYFRDEESTKAAFDADGWFLTGDVGEADKDGNIRILGRVKENIVLASGKKITPDEVEQKYEGIAGVKEFVICGVPHEGETYDDIHAFIVPASSSQEAQDTIQAAVRERGVGLRQYMRVTQMHFVSEIPRTALQKPKRYLLKQWAIKERETGAPISETAAPAKDDMESRVIAAVAKASNTPADSITRDTKIFSELSIDSLSSISLALDLEDLYKVNIESYYFDDMTVADIMLALQNKAPQKRVIGQENVDYPQRKSNGDYYAYAFFRNLAQFCYKLRVHNIEKVPVDQGFIICANHVSKIDYLYITSAFSKERFKKICCMAKKELFRNDPFSRKLIKSAGMVPVDRSGINMKTMNNLKEKLHENWGVVIHPEGTRSEDGIFREIKSGAAVLAIDAGVSIVPAYVNGAYEVFPRDRKVMKVFDWKHMKKFEIDVTFGDPIAPDGKDVQMLTKEVQDAILNLQSEYKKEN